MNKEQLTNEKVDRISALSRFVSVLTEDASGVSTPIESDGMDNVQFSPLTHYGRLIEKYGLSDVLETYRAILHATLQRKVSEKQAELLKEINNVE